ncbi:MAG: ATP-binding protein [Desulfobacterales bacterium]|nr:ATP-binding protein [Desulfobacterales bacterium]
MYHKKEEKSLPQFEGLDIQAPEDGSHIRRYRRVFLLDRLEFAPDPIRTEDAASAARLEALLVESYRKLGYRIIWIPALCVDDRVEWILKNR